MYKKNKLKGLKKVSCGDWHLSWGFGTTKIGNLYKLSDNIYLWKGHSQGRHGQVWNKGAYSTFSVKDNNINTIETNNLGFPKTSEVLKAVEELNKLI